MRILRLRSRPQSSTEKAGLPIADVQRSQLDTSPTSPQPHGIRKRNAARKATTPANTETHLRDVTFTTHSMDVPPSKCLIFEGLSYGRLCEHTQAIADVRRDTKPFWMGHRPTIFHKRYFRRRIPAVS